MNLAPFQTKAVDCACDSLSKNRAALLVLATGLGKTIIFCSVAKRYVDRGRVMVLAHRKELIEQAASKVRHWMCINPGIEKAETYSPEESMYGKPQVVVGSVQTQIAGHKDGRRMERFDPNEFSLLILDEAHHAVADSYRGVLQHYQKNPNLHVLGVTATPDRKDKLAMGTIFDHCPFQMDIRAGRDAGYLVQIDAQFVEVKGFDLSGCKTVAGDLNAADLARAIATDDKVLLGFASGIVQNSGNRQTLVFSDSIDNATNLTRMINSHREGSANLITGKTQDQVREELIHGFRHQAYQYMVNVGIATEGFDVPNISCVALCRPTKSRALFTQMIGRGTRPVVDGLYAELDDGRRIQMIAGSAKPDLLILDFVGNSGRHKLVHVGDVLGGRYTQEEIRLAQLRMKESGGPKNVEDALEAARKELATQHAKTPWKVAAKANVVKQSVDLFGIYDVRIQTDHGLVGQEPATDKQIGLLTNLGFEVSEGLTKREASKVIGATMKRKEDGLVYRPKMIRTLGKYHYDWKTMTVEAAKATIAQLERNGWRPVR